MNIFKALIRAPLLSSVGLAVAACGAGASEIIAINPIHEAVLLDGRCGGDEWDVATKIELPARASIYLAHDGHSFYFCAKGAPEDTTVLDLYIEHPATGNIHKFHLSAQMGEEVFMGDEWSEPATWQLDDWTGFWVPYFGNEETENGLRPKFYRQSDRQVQVLRRKFPGNTWNMMFVVSIGRDGEWNDIHFPEGAVDLDKATWGAFSFSE